MEMSAAYMAETVNYLSDKGFNIIEIEICDRLENGELIYEGKKYQIDFEDSVKLEMENLFYPDKNVTKYFLQVNKYFGIVSTSFPLDSWKYRDDWIEFKYYIHPETGLGHAFQLFYPKQRSNGGTI